MSFTKFIRDISKDSTDLQKSENAAVINISDQIASEALKSRNTINLQEEKGETALTLSAQRNYAACVTALLKSEKIDVNVRNSSGLPPLALINLGEEESIEIADLILNHDSFNPNKYFFNNRQEQHLALYFFNKGKVANQHQAIDLVIKLLNHPKAKLDERGMKDLDGINDVLIANSIVRRMNGIDPQKAIKFLDAIYNQEGCLGQFLHAKHNAKRIRMTDSGLEIIKKKLAELTKKVEQKSLTAPAKDKPEKLYFFPGTYGSLDDSDWRKKSESEQTSQQHYQAKL